MSFDKAPIIGVERHRITTDGDGVTTLVGFYTAEHLGFSNDPLRMGAQVISGVGFLGVGTIVIRHQSQVKGLTTAAGLWAAAASQNTTSISLVTFSR